MAQASIECVDCLVRVVHYLTKGNLTTASAFPARRMQLWRSLEIRKRWRTIDTKCRQKLHTA